MAAAVMAIVIVSKNKTVTHVHTPNKIFTVIIDAGHGAARMKAQNIKR